MSLPTPKFPGFLKRPYALRPLEKVSGYTRTLPPGDKLVLSVLASILALTSLLGVFALVASVMEVKPSYGGVLTEGVLGAPRFVHPLLASTDAEHDLVRITYAGLMGNSGSDGLVPVLASGYTASGSGTVYTFTLRENARFTDGTPVTAEDVVFTIKKAQDPGLKSPEFANWSNVLAEVVDASTVRFTLPKAYAPFIENATLGILPAHLWRSVPVSQFPFSPLTERPVGAGPFKVTRVTTGKGGEITSYEVSAFDDYALGRAYLDQIRLRFFASSETLSKALENGTIDSAYGLEAKSAEGKQLLTSPYARVFGVFFNPVQQPLFAHLEVRKALSLAIDREHIVDGILGGYATALMGPVPPGSGAKLTAVPYASSPVESATKVLTSAGWKQDKETLAWTLPAKKKGGPTETLSFSLTTAQVPELKAIAQSIKQDWEQLGVPVEVKLYDPSEITGSVIRPRAYDALFFGEVVGSSRDLYAFWNSTQKVDPGLNIALYSNTSVDSLIGKLRSESDERMAREELGTLDRMIAEDFPAAFTHAPDFLYVVPKDLKGVVLPQISAPADRFATVARWYMATTAVFPFLTD